MKGPAYPRAVVFGPAGQELFQGSLEEAVKVTEKAAGEAPRVWVGPTPYVRLQALARQVERGEKGSSLGQIAQALRRKTQSANAVERAEAGHLLEALDLHVAGDLARAQELAGLDPDLALATVKALAADFSGDEIGSRLAAEARQWAADPDLSAFRKATAEIDALQRRLEALPPCKAHKQHGKRRAVAGCAGCCTLNREALVDIRKALQDAARRAGDTPAADRARRLAETFPAEQKQE